MVLLEPGYRGSVPDAGYIRINGTDHKIAELEIVEDLPNGKLGINRFGKVICLPMRYSYYTVDGTGFAPMDGYEALLQALAGLHAYRYSGAHAVKIRSVSGTNEQLLTVGRTQLHAIVVWNGSGHAAFLKLFDKSESPVPGTDVPLMTFDTLLLPGGAVTFGAPVIFDRGLGICITALGDDGDNHAVGDGDVIVTLVWE